MPYAPGISYDTSSVANGLNAGLADLQQGFKEFQMNKAKKTAAQGVVTGLLQSNPELLQGADDKTAKLLEKFKSGNTGLDDDLFLAGWATTTQKGWEMKQQLTMQKLQQQAEQAKVDKAQAEMAADTQARSRLTQVSQYMDGVGKGVLTPQAQSNLATLAKDPMMSEAARAYAATGDVPRAETLLNNDSRQQIDALKAQHATELFQLKQQQAGGYATQKEAVDAAKASGAKSVTVQQNGAGRWLASATFDDGSKPSKMAQGDLQRSISLRTRMGQLSNAITQIKAGNMSYVGAGAKLPTLENELKTLQAEFDKITAEDEPKPLRAPVSNGFTVRAYQPPAK